NYGLFYSDRMLERVVKKIDSETRRLKGKKALIGECGHASRSAKYFLPTYCGGKDAYPVINIMEYTWDVWKKGRLKLDPNVVTEVVTYHDPCNIARQGWIIDKPRDLLKAFCKNYVEMTPSGQDNICCGGGGGTVSIDEIRSYRTMVGGKLKADQIRATGCKYLVAPCANCKKQLRELVEDQGIDCEVVGLHDLLYKAIIFDDSLKVKKPEESTIEESKE
ncbi:MAG: (Fe-S)-binding protein, partial [candidate division Zixibacteria bacterium]|nr:(Fe-S)-binding protein [candidate division Zixibacteria bacterium]